MKAKITVFLIALTMIFPAKISEARVVKQEQSWLEKIFSNDSDEMIQKSPFSQPQKRTQNPRFRQPQNDSSSNTEEARTQDPKQPERVRKLGRHSNPQNDLSQNYAERIQSLRQQRMNALRNPQAASSSGVND